MQSAKWHIKKSSKAPHLHITYLNLTTYIPLQYKNIDADFAQQAEMHTQLYNCFPTRMVPGI